MSARGPLDVLELVSRYAAGYFPLYDMTGRFYWERLAFRAVLPVDQAMVRRARRMGRRGAGRFAIRYNAAVETVIAALAQEEIKPRTWVRREVVRIYETLHAVGLLRTIEAWETNTGQLAGALLGIIMPGTFVAETMFGVAPEASKVCLCRLVEDCFACGQAMIDVQTPHDVDESGRRVRRPDHTPHPCLRLGEEVITLGAFMRHFAAAWRRQFAGGINQWVASAALVRDGTTPPDAAGLPAGLTPPILDQARRLLAVTPPASIHRGK